MQLKHGNKTIIINIKNCLRMHWFSVLVSSWLKKKKPLMVIRRRKYQSLFNWWQFYEWVEDINIEKTKKVDIIKIYGRRGQHSLTFCISVILMLMLCIWKTMYMIVWLTYCWILKAKQMMKLVFIKIFLK